MIFISFAFVLVLLLFSSEIFLGAGSLVDFVVDSVEVSSNARLLDVVIIGADDDDDDVVRFK